MKKIHLLFLALSLILLGSCSHKYDSNTLGLDFYQWNLWEDTEAVQGDDLPSCGWDDLHRGKGKLVRIPASLDQHFQGFEDSDVFWYHCRFTLPEQWEEKSISMDFVGVGPAVKVFLNGEEAGSFQGEKGVFKLDVSDVIFYTRDNHLAIRVSGAEGEAAGKRNGITGTILVKSGS